MQAFTVTRINSMTGKKVVKTVECNCAYAGRTKGCIKLLNGECMAR